MGNGFRPESVVLPLALMVVALVLLVRTRRLGRRFVAGAFAATLGAIAVSLPWLMVRKGDTSTLFYLVLLNGYLAVPVCLCLSTVALLLRSGRALRPRNRRA